MLRALRNEAVYVSAGDQFVDLGGLYHEIDLLLDISQAVAPVEQIAEFSAKSIQGTAKPQDRMAKAYATGSDDGPTYQEMLKEGGGEHADG